MRPREDPLEGTWPVSPLPEPDPSELPMGAGLPPALGALEARVTTCVRCPRLVAWREAVAAEKRRAFADEPYWGRPIPGWGDPAARVLIVGLAPAAHGGNRTGRAFTGDESGRWLYRALWRNGFASGPGGDRADDGLVLDGCFVTAAVRCAPPANRPTPAEREACRPYLEAEIDLLPEVRAIVTLGGFAFDQTLRIARGRGHAVPVPKPRFGHGALVDLGPGGPVVLASYHPSQQNTFTGVLTEPMLDAVFARARALAGLSR